MLQVRDPKDPDATLDYTIDWSAWLNGDTIVTSQWSVPTGITRNSDTNSASAATVWLSGGMHSKDYYLTNRITTAAGRIEEQTLLIKVRNF